MCIEDITSIGYGHQVKGINYCAVGTRNLEDGCPNHRVFETHIENICNYCSAIPVWPASQPANFRSRNEMAKAYLTAAYGAPSQHTNEQTKQVGIGNSDVLPPPPPYRPSSEMQATENSTAPSTFALTTAEMDVDDDDEEENYPPPPHHSMYPVEPLDELIALLAQKPLTPPEDSIEYVTKSPINSLTGRGDADAIQTTEYRSPYPDDDPFGSRLVASSSLSSSRSYSPRL